MKVSEHSFIFKATLLSISLFLGSASVVSAAIPLIHQDFGSIPLNWIENLLSIPSLSVIVMLLVSPFIANKLGNKKTIFLGLLISAVTGVIPVFTNNFTIVFLSRIGLGIGLGFYNSLAVSIISYYYNGKERAAMMGLQSAMAGIGNLIMGVLASVLLSISWHAVFLIYGLIFLVIPLFLVVIPNNQQGAQNADATVPLKKEKEHVNSKVVLVATSLFFLMLVINLVTIKVPSLITSEHIGNASQAAMVLAVMGFSSMFGSSGYGFIEPRLKNWTMTLATLGSASGLFVIYNANSLLFVFLGIAIFGFFISMAAPFLFTMAADVAPKGSANLASAVVLLGNNLSTLIAPSFWNGIGGLMGSSSATSIMFDGILLMILITIISFIYSFKNNQHTVSIS